MFSMTALSIMNLYGYALILLAIFFFFSHFISGSFSKRMNNFSLFIIHGPMKSDIIIYNKVNGTDKMPAVSPVTENPNPLRWKLVDYCWCYHSLAGVVPSHESRSMVYKYCTNTKSSHYVAAIPIHLFLVLSFSNSFDSAVSDFGFYIRLVFLPRC